MNGPVIDFLLRLSESERPHAVILSGSLGYLDYYVECFAAGLALFDSCWNEQKRTGRTGVHSGTHLTRLSKWKLLAARDGIQSIYQIGHTLKNIGSARHKIPSIDPFVDKVALKSATKEFRRRFENFNDLRNAVSHAAEMTSDPEHFDTNAFVGNFENGFYKIADAKRLMVVDILSQRCFMKANSDLRNKRCNLTTAQNNTEARLVRFQAN